MDVVEIKNILNSLRIKWNLHHPVQDFCIFTWIASFRIHQNKWIVFVFMRCEFDLWFLETLQNKLSY